MALFIGKTNLETSLIARFGVSSDKIKELLDKYAGPKVGDLRYQASASPDTTLVKGADGVYMPTADFDGWAYPRQSIVLRKSVFPEAYELYGESGRNTFNLPEINDVPLKMLGNLSTSKPGIQDILKQLKVPPHCHTIGTVVQSRITLTNGLAYISSGGNGSSNEDAKHYVSKDFNHVKKVKLPRFHNGKVQNTMRPVPLDIDMTVEDATIMFGENAETEDTGYTNAEGTFILDHLTMPIMVYIGKPHESSDEPLDTFTVRFYLDSSKTELIASRSVAYGHDATPPSNPTKPGHRFLRWNGAYTNVMHDVDVYAEWEAEAIPTCIVTWNGNGGSDKGTTTVEKGQAIKTAISTLPTSTRTGYTQNKWWTTSSGGSEVTLNTVVNNSLTAYAHWTANPVEPSLVMIRFNANGGNISSTEIEHIVWGYAGQQFSTIGGLGSFTFPIPTKPGYDCVGWYTESTSGTKIELHTLIPNVAEVTYYAHWNKAFDELPYVCAIRNNLCSWPFKQKSSAYGEKKKSELINDDLEYIQKGFSAGKLMTYTNDKAKGFTITVTQWQSDKATTDYPIHVGASSNKFADAAGILFQWTDDNGNGNNNMCNRNATVTYPKNGGKFEGLSSVTVFVSNTSGSNFDTTDCGINDFDEFKLTKSSTNKEVVISASVRINWFYD